MIDARTWDFLVDTEVFQEPEVFVVESDRWESELRSAVQALPPAATIVILLRRGLAVLILEALAGRFTRRLPGPPLQRVLAALTSEGIEKVATYGVWPSLENPRFLYTGTSTTAAKWIHRSGALGGGGTRLWARRLARSSLFAPLIGLLTPGYALVGRKEQVDRTTN